MRARSPYWGWLLAAGVLLGAIAGVLLFFSDTEAPPSRDNPPLVDAKAVLLVAAQVTTAIGSVLLGAGAVGLGVASAGVRPALDELNAQLRQQ